MKTKLFPTVAALAAAFLASQATAQDTPAAVMTSAGATAATVAAAPAPNQTIYVPRLPSAQELTNAASAQAGVSIDRIESSNAQVTVIYKFANGQTNTVAYELLPAANSAPGQSAAPVATTTPPPTVVYQTAPRVVYYSDPYYYPDYSYYPGYYWYPPVSLSLGLGYIWHGGYYHGGYYHGGGNYHGGGFHHH